LNEVLQTQRVFINVSKGEFAKKGDLVKAFGDVDEREVIEEVSQIYILAV
jgi:ribosome maturation protein SDO1